MANLSQIKNMEEFKKAAKLAFYAFLLAAIGNLLSLPAYLLGKNFMAKFNLSPMLVITLLSIGSLLFLVYFVLLFTSFKKFSKAFEDKKVFSYLVRSIVTIIIGVVLFFVLLALGIFLQSSNLSKVVLLIVSVLILLIAGITAIVFFLLSFYRLSKKVNNKRIFIYMLLELITGWIFPLFGVIFYGLLAYEFYKLNKVSLSKEN